MNESKLSKKNLEKKGEKIGKKKNENLKVGHQGFRLTTGRAEEMRARGGPGANPTM